jgi:hypothetical protein
LEEPLVKLHNVNGVNDIRQTEMRTGKTLVLQPAAFVIFIQSVMQLTVIIIEAGHCHQLCTEFYPKSFRQLTPYVDKTNGDHQCGFQGKSTRDHLHSSNIYQKK